MKHLYTAEMPMIITASELQLEEIGIPLDWVNANITAIPQKSQQQTFPLYKVKREAMQDEFLILESYIKPTNKTS